MPVSPARQFGVAALSLSLLGAPVCAEDQAVPSSSDPKRVVLGWTTFATNDALGDGQDRWQSFSSSTSILMGPAGTFALPERFGQVIEFRFGSQIITPENTTTPAPGDRPVAGVVQAGLYTHAARGAWAFTFGAGVEAVGPRTGVIALQDRFHSAFGFDRIAPAAIGSQVGNRIRPMAELELSYRLAVTDDITFRPFASARTGLETLGRVGADVVIGPGYTNGVLARDLVTGQFYQTIEGVNAPGVSAVFGADVARVASSAYLPSPAYRLSPYRARVRGGLLVEDRNFSVFYGATYLAREFTTQSAGQVVGSLQVQLNF